ncbi:MAG: hypothetical protein A2X49_01090 [Lentisphaerae bacterium GWF2_52_8]|nr:MAG: hypothetical protein A2X49_01090 [Lentisphaerae bacterium GWF2_52_8]
MNPFLKRFTLVELLVVMAIIALLAGLAFPVLAKVRERSRMSTCASNLRQIGIAINSYTGDNKDMLPVCEKLNSLYGLPTVKEVLSPYLSSTSIFACPSDIRHPPALFDSTGTSYEWNTFVSGHKIDRTNFSIAGQDVLCPIYGDANAFHSKRRNYLYPDGRVLDKLEVLINNDPI